MTIDPVEISIPVIAETIRLLREARERECVLLWLGRRKHGIQCVVGVYRPIQKAVIDYFEIPRQGMAELMSHLHTHRLYVAVQVHTHPEEAFHSLVDDEWAIVRHCGALSIVVPWFAATVTPANFTDVAAVYQLDSANAWNRVEEPSLSAILRIVP
ncbi:MAG: hypothetical protein M0Z85_12885 [Gammaproteobacteria bacterium]|nr:hypothetical protein [Gammaproteobacteria bacterium]